MHGRLHSLYVIADQGAQVLGVLAAKDFCDEALLKVYLLSVDHRTRDG